jgi:hypothetical protein
MRVSDQEDMFIYWRPRACPVGCRAHDLADEWRVLEALLPGGRSRAVRPGGAGGSCLSQRGVGPRPRPLVGVRAPSTVYGDPTPGWYFPYRGAWHATVADFIPLEWQGVLAGLSRRINTVLHYLK